VAGVSVRVVNTDTNFQFQAITNSDGLFRVQSLQPGPYRVTFEAAGFKRLVREGIDLRVGDTHGVHAFKMGYELLRNQSNSRATSFPSGQFLFDGMTSGLQLNGVWRRRIPATRSPELTTWLPRSSIHSFYFQDDWKFSPCSSGWISRTCSIITPGIPRLRRWT